MRTVGVEEEYLLVDPDSGHPRAVSHVALAADSGDQLTAELQREQLESATRPCTHPGRGRGRAAPGPGRGGAGRPAPRARSWRRSRRRRWPSSRRSSPSERYREMGRRFGLTVSEELTCGCHVHVGIDSDDEGVGALDRIRPWLPPLLALTANSPFWQGADSGYASYRSQVWQRWPSAGPYAPFGSPAGYRATVQAMIDTDTLLDPGMVYFDARLSAQHPTRGGAGRRRVPGRRRRGAARRAGPGAGGDGGAGVAGRCARRPGASRAAAAGGVARGPLGPGRRAARSLLLAPDARGRRARPAGHARRPGAGGGGDLAEVRERLGEVLERGSGARSQRGGGRPAGGRGAGRPPDRSA